MPRSVNFSPAFLFLQTSMKIILCLVLAILLPGFARAVEIPLDLKQSSLKFTGHAFLHDFDGQAKEFAGSAQVDARKPELVVSAKIEITAAKMTTFESGRDQNMLQWLHADAIPEISFELTHVISMDGNAATATKDHPAKFLVSGNFTLNKVAKPLQTVAMGWREGKWLVVTGTTSVNTADHGLPIIEQFFMTVDKDVDVRFHLVFDLPSNLQMLVKP